MADLVPKQIQTNSFTTKHDRRVNVLKSETLVSEAFDPSLTSNLPPHKKFWAIWDTGATNSVISKKVVDECGLKPISMTQVHTAGGTKTSLVYLVNIVLRNNVGIPQIRVTEGNLRNDADVLIGMDIISQGDFAVTNRDGKTTFSFRIPSIECIDFVEQKPSSMTSPIKKTAPKVGRNDPCPCGSGKKYKKCCGKVK